MKRQATDLEKEKVNSPMSSEIIEINAGGTYLSTTLYTLTRTYPDSMIAVLFGDRQQGAMSIDRKGRHFIDTDGHLFSHILHYMRRSIPFNNVPHNIEKEIWLREIDFWGLPLQSDDVIIVDDTKTTVTELVIPMITEAERRMNEAMIIALKLSGATDRILNGAIEVYVYVPFDVYTTTWDIDLARFLYHATNMLTSNYPRVKTKTNPIGIYSINTHSMAKAREKTYRFDGVEYTTLHQTLEILLNILQ